jgi:ribosomal protein L16 Arg81 hydroxylase
MRLDELLAPFPVDCFEADYFGQRPLHIAAMPGIARKPIDWPGFNRLLALRSHWSEANIKLIMNSRPVQADFYIDEVETHDGRVRRASPAKVEFFLGMGASLVANAVEDISPEIGGIVSSLADHFSGKAGANIYCSFQDVQAFASHCDLHEVFVIQCEGEKIWNIYANRAASPVEPLEGDDAQAVIDRAKGPVLMQVRMRPGDLLYIPRGYYHDALATSDASLHVTFAVAPLTGRILFRLLETLAMEDETFRAYLPDARGDEGARLAERLDMLGDRIAELVRSRRFAAELADRQRALWEPDHVMRLPERPILHFYARTDRPAEVSRGPDGARLATPGGAPLDLASLAGPAEWLLGRPAFALEELCARFRHIDRAELERMATDLEARGILVPYRPERG